MLANLKRSRFIAAILVFVVYLVKLKYPEFPHEAAYGFIAYILGESANDALRHLKKPCKERLEKLEAQASEGKKEK